LRALAVLSVIGFHASPTKFKGGFVGVDIFFVISGFLISSIIYGELQADKFSIVEFYVRRIRRILPALLLVLVSVGIAGWLFLLPTDFVVLGKQIIGGSTFAANFVLWWQSGYFTPEAALKPLLHLWSLGVEEQYYLIFPLICIAFYRSRPRWTLPAAFLGIAGFSMLVNVAFVQRHAAASYFLPFSRLWELFLGAGLSLIMQHHLQAPWEFRLLARWQHGIGLLGLSVLILSVFGIDDRDAFPGWWALLPTIGAVLVIAVGQSSWVNRYLLSSRPAVLIGLFSYPLYLWHWPILSFMRIAEVNWGIKISHVEKVAGITLAFGLAYLTYRFVELPIREVKQRSQRRKGSLLLLGSVCLTGACGLLIVLTGGFPTRLPGGIVALDHDYALDASKSWREGTCFLSPEQTAASFTKNCLDSATGLPAHPLVFVWGDSHAAHLLPGFRALQHQSGVRLAQYTASMCAPIIGLSLRERPNCEEINDAILEKIRVIKPDIVVLSAYWDYVDPDHHRDIRAEKLLHTIELVKAAGIQRVVVVGSVPFWTKPVEALLVEELRENPNQPVRHRLARSLADVYDDRLLKLTTEQAGAFYIPVFDDLCDQSSCIATTGPGWQDLVTFDNSHFTEHGSLIVAQLILESIVGAAPMPKLGRSQGLYSDRGVAGRPYNH
jgi:peptidoglycan/LPS O-acetylase OafA/YrhL